MIKKYLTLGVTIICGLILAVLLFIILLVGFFFGMEGDKKNKKSNMDYEGFGYACFEDKELDLAIFENAFANKGKLSPHADDFINYANQYNIDPVLLASVSFLETANGTSKALKDKNNTGGLMGSDGLMSFSSIQESLEVQARSISNRINEIIGSKGEYKLEYLRDKYAPLGASNDPNNLNSHWLPNVISYASQLGGFTMNCEASSYYAQYGTLIVNGELAYPLANLVVTSSFGHRGVDPVTGVYESLHRGVDYSCQQGEPIYAIMGGIVQTSTYHSSWGNYVQILHSDGTGSLYAHMTKAIVKNGENIKVGQQIGTCGSSGSSTGNHLHLEFAKNGVDYFNEKSLVDPHKILISAIASKEKE